MKNKTFYLVGGGTSGHVNPALSIAEVMQEKYPESRIVFFVTETGVEYEMIKNAGFPCIVIEASRLPSSVNDFFSFLKASRSGYKSCIDAIKKDRPVAIIGTGGFVCAPLLLAAMRLKVPYLIHEQNAFPGKANRFFAKKAKAVCISFESSREHFNTEAPIHLTGNPVRKIFFDKNPVNARQELEVSSDKFLVLMMGGSLGATSINQAVLDLFKKGIWQSLKKEYPELMFVMSTGERNYDSLRNKLASFETEDFLIKSYLDSTTWLPASDLFIGRAGASSCFEAAATATPAIFIPFQYAADNHQFFNAKSFADQRAAIMIEDKDINAQVLADQIVYLIENRRLMYEMSKKAKSLSMPDAALHIVEILDQVIDLKQE